jgi:malonyl-CoA O-methyltransferase
MAPLTPLAAYELWADTYPAEAHNPLMDAEQTIVERIVTHLRARRALDVGTGSGRYLPILALTGAAVVGIDLSLPMLRRGGGRRCVCADAYTLPFGRTTFDLVNASLMVGDVSRLADWTGEMARVLTPGGHLVYSDFHPTWIERGWQRTFRAADGALHTIPFAPHAIDDHLAAIEAAGLVLVALREPRLTVRRVNAPVLAIVHAVKRGRNVWTGADGREGESGQTGGTRTPGGVFR